MDEKCGFCGLGEEATICGSLHCEKVGEKLVAAHHKCMQYSALLIQYKSEHFGGFKLGKVTKELTRGRKLNCTLCRKKGASAGCAWASCRRTFHYPCAFNHQLAVTKRYKVQSGTKTVILYRVFCSSEHEQAYRQNIKVTGFGKSSPGKQNHEKTKPVSPKDSKTTRSPIEIEQESRKRKRESEISSSENDEGEESEEFDKTNLSMASADLNETAMSLIDSPGMTGEEVVEQARKEYSLLKAKSKVEKKGEKRPRLIDKSENKDDTENNLPMTRLIDKAESKDKPKNNSPSKTKLTDKLENLSRKIKLIDKAENKDDLEKKLSSKTKVIDKLENKPEKNLSKMKLIDKSENKVEKNLSNRTMSSTATNVSNTESQSSYFDLTNSLSPEASDHGSDKMDDVTTEQQEKGPDPPKADEEVVLLIPSLIWFPDQVLQDVCRELDITSEQSIVWPPTVGNKSVQEIYLPHVMWDVVNTIRMGGIGELTSVLSNISEEKYEYFLSFHSEQKDNINQQVFHSIAEKLETLNGKSSRKIGKLVSRKYQKMKFLVLYLSAQQPSHRNLISVLQDENLFEWNRDTSVKNMFSHSRNSELECKKLWNWFKSKLTTNFQFDTCPAEEIFLNEKYSSDVSGNVIDKLSTLPYCSSLGSNTIFTVLAIDGANRDVVNFKAFVQRAIERFVKNSLSKEIFFLITIEKIDEIQTFTDILPARLVKDARVYSAFSPEEFCLSCIVVDVIKGDVTTTPGPVAKRKSSPSSSITSTPDSVAKKKFSTSDSVRKMPDRNVKNSPSSHTSPVVLLTGSSNLKFGRSK